MGTAANKAQAAPRSRSTDGVQAYCTKCTAHARKRCAGRTRVYALGSCCNNGAARARGRHACDALSVVDQVALPPALQVVDDHSVVHSVQQHALRRQPQRRVAARGRHADDRVADELRSRAAWLLPFPPRCVIQRQRRKAPHATALRGLWQDAARSRCVGWPCIGSVGAAAQRSCRGARLLLLRNIAQNGGALPEEKAVGRVGGDESAVANCCAGDCRRVAQEGLVRQLLLAFAAIDTAMPGALDHARSTCAMSL